MEEEIIEEPIHASKLTWKQILKTMWLDKVGVIGMLISCVVESLIDVSYPLLNKYALEHYFIENADYSRVTREK